MALINCIKSHFSDALVKRCSDKSCELTLDGLGQHVVLKGERLCTDRKICDCIIFAKDTYIVVGIVELKSKTVHPSAVVKKLENGSDLAQFIVEKCTDSPMNLEFYHIVLAKRWSTSAYRTITSNFSFR
jgi:hypothetical protein